MFLIRTFPAEWRTVILKDAVTLMFIFSHAWQCIPQNPQKWRYATLIVIIWLICQTLCTVAFDYPHETCVVHREGGIVLQSISIPCEMRPSHRNLWQSIPVLSISMELHGLIFEQRRQIHLFKEFLKSIKHRRMPLWLWVRLLTFTKSQLLKHPHDAIQGFIQARLDVLYFEVGIFIDID